MPWGAAAAAAGSVIGGGISALGASSAAKTSAAASNEAALMKYTTAQEQMQNVTPQINLGQVASTTLQNALYEGMGQPYDTSTMPQFSWNPTQAGLEQTPGYQFTLDQGLKATQNAAAARGLGVSGAALQGAAGYATGQANTTYNQQLSNAINTYGTQLQGWQQGFTDYWSNQNNRFSQLYNLAALGSNAAVGAGTNAANLTTSAGNSLTQAGQATAAGQQGAATDVSNSLNNALTSPAVQSYLTSLGSGGSTVTNQGGASGGGTSDASTGAWNSYLQGQ